MKRKSARRRTTETPKHTEVGWEFDSLEYFPHPELCVLCASAVNLSVPN